MQSLSPGNQKIAQALFAAQHPVGAGPTPLTVDQIAGLKGTGGWGKVFQQMKTSGLIQSRNLGQVVSASSRPLAAPHFSGGMAGGRSPIVITNGSGRNVTIASPTVPSAGGRFAAPSAHSSPMTVTTAAGAPLAPAGIAGAGHVGGGHSSSMTVTTAAGAPAGVAGGGHSGHGGGHER